ncbi:MAG: hypothetical protein J0L56_08065 [Chitinophagales bacterium]|nr:hypothetical protein [Chitinophagales bacterium]
MRWSFAFLFLILCFTGKTQSSSFTFTNYTIANGLADNAVNCITQDFRGFIWVGTREGLSRYDGTSFKNFFTRKNDSTALPGNTIGSLIEYKPGYLLMTCASQVVSMNTMTGEFHQLWQFRNKVIYFIRPLGNQSFTVNRIDSSFVINAQLQITDTIVPPFSTKGGVPRIVSLNNNNWLVGTPWQYFIYNTDSKKYTLFLGEKDMPDREKMLEFQYYDEKKGHLYFSNYFEGLYRYSATGVLLQHWKAGHGLADIEDGNIAFVLRKSDSTFWVGAAEGGGLSILNTRTNLFTRVKSDDNYSSLVSNSLTFNFTDRDKNEWIGSTNGISKLNISTSGIKSWRNEFRELVKNNTLLGITKGKDQHIYTPVFNSNIVYRINNRNDRVSLLNRAKMPANWCMNPFGNDLVFSGGTAVTKFNPLTGQYTKTDFLKKYFPLSDIIILAFKHSNGDEWYSGNNGGGFIRITKEGSVYQYKKDGPRGNFSVSYYSVHAEDKKGDLWFGVNKSSRLLHWNKEADYFTEVAFDTVKGLNETNLAGITDLLIDNDNNIWIAFDGTGVGRYNPVNRTATHYTIQNGLPTNYVYALRFDKHNRLWIGTLKGLSCLLVNENKFINFSKEDGLPADYFSERCIYYDSSANHLWIGSRTTLMRFNPDLLLRNTRKTIPIYLDEVMVNGRQYYTDSSGKTSFSPSGNNLQFRFIGLDINSGNDIEYSYRLTGADQDWIYNSNITTASYANLAPGKYAFTVRARHKGDNEWSMMQTPFAFSIQTPWTKTWWWKFLLVTVAAAVVWFIIRSYYLRKLEHQKAVLEKKQAIEKERTRIATDMHDDFGASLSRIKFLSEKIQLQKNEDLKMNEDLGKISAYSDEMAEKMGEIVWALNQRYDSSGDLVSFCRSYASEYLEDKNIKLSFSSNMVKDIKINGEIRRNIFLVMKEALHNVVKHAHATAVSITIDCDKELKVRIRDNGRGFDPQAVRPFANGLENMKKRTGEILGAIRIENKNGTEVSITVDPGIQQNTYGQ